MTIQLSTTEQYIRQLLADNGAVELRHQNDERWITGWFNDPEKLLQEARKRSRRGNLFTSLNAPKPRIVANNMTGTPVRDDEIGWINRVPFDFDPARPAGTSSTDDELSQTYPQRDKLVSALTSIGWPIPLLAKSGNGYHCQFRTRLPNNSETKEMLQAIYQGLYLDFESPGVGFDRTVRNPGRIFRLYGSTNRKGPNTIDRPWRKSTCLIPDPWRQVTAQQLATLADAYAKRITPAQKAHAPANKQSGSYTGSGDFSTLDVVSWFSAHGLYKRPLSGGKHAVTCPWVSQHSTEDKPSGTDSVVWEAVDGWPGFHCSHSHCSGRGIRDVMTLWGDADQFCAAEWTRGAHR